jgi:hypothetical protein
MKKLFTIVGIFLTPMSFFSQSRLHAINSHEISFPIKNKTQAKSTMCNDTLRYPNAKEFMFGTNTYYYLELFQQDNEAMSMTFLATHTTSIKGIEIYARKNSASPTNVVVRCAVFNVNASGDPTTMMGSGTVNLSSTLFSSQIVNFAIPILVTGNYAIVVESISLNGIADLLTNDVDGGQLYDEGLARFKSNYYPSSNGNWIGLPSFSEFVVQNADFEPIVAPIISYTLNTVANASLNATCIGTPISFNETTTPTGIEGNRFYNWWTMVDYFNLPAIDSTYQWYFGTGNPEATLTGNSTSYTYNASGSYGVSLYNYGGFWGICTDSSNIVINITQPIVNAGGDLTVCQGDAVTLNATGANTYSWNNNVQNGQSFVPINNGITNFQVIGTDLNGCTDIDSLVLNVNQITSSTINQTAIDSFIFNNAILTQSGTYYDTLIGSNDCDSIITLNLTLEFTGLSIQDFNDIKIYPNPTNGLIFIECSNFESAEITDLCGKKIMTLKTKEIDLSELASGFYCLKIINTMLQEHTETIIKQ